MNASETALGLPALAILACVGPSAPAHAAPATDLNCKGCVDKKDLAKNAVDTKRIKDGSIKADDLHKSAKPSGVIRAEAATVATIGTGYEALISTSIDAPGPGFVTVFATWVFDPDDVADAGRCNLAMSEGVEQGLYAQANQILTPGALVRTFDVPAGETTFYLNCNDLSTQMEFRNPSISGIYSPTNYFTE